VCIQLLPIHMQVAASVSVLAADLANTQDYLSEMTLSPAGKAYIM